MWSDEEYVPNIGILLTHAYHYTLMAGTTNDGTGKRVNESQRLRIPKDIRENGTGCIITWMCISML
jgi:hypothetical protein